MGRSTWRSLRCLGVSGAWLVAASVAAAQNTPPVAATANSSVSGVVKNAETGQPLADYVVSTFLFVAPPGNIAPSGPPPRVVKSATTDEQGRYRLDDLPPGAHQITVASQERPPRRVSRRVNLTGSNLNNIDFNIVPAGRISGKVIDENQDPMPGLFVFLVSRQYYLGSLLYRIESTARTDDRGQYTLPRVEPGRPYLVLAETRKLSDAPANPKMRLPVPMRTWYPNSASRDNAKAITVRPGEAHGGTDIAMQKSPNYCMEGVVSGPNGPAAPSLSIEPLTPSSGRSSNGGVFISAPGVRTEADGKFRACGLYPGAYRLMARERGALGNQMIPAMGFTTVTISDRDITGVTVTTSLGAPLQGEVVLDGPAPQTPITAKIYIGLELLMRSGFQGEDYSVDADVPGTFSLSSPLFDTYTVSAGASAPGLYVKDITYGASHVLHAPLQFASGNTRLRVTVGQDGAKLNARVNDKDGNPAPDTNVVLFPADVTSEAMLQAAMIARPPRPTGEYTSPILAPGKYYVFATPDSYDATVESIDKLWRSRDRFTQVDLPPNGTAQVTLTPVSLP